MCGLSVGAAGGLFPNIAPRFSATPRAAEAAQEASKANSYAQVVRRIFDTYLAHFYPSACECLELWGSGATPGPK